jgi:putative phosphoesterase
MHEPRALSAFLASGQYDLIVYGHTHKPEIRGGRPLLINPGELGGWLTGQPSAALVDLEALKGELLRL